MADGLLPSPPGIDLQHSLQRRGRECHVSVSNRLIAVCFIFPSLPPLLSLPLSCSLRYESACGRPSPGLGPSPEDGNSAQASSDEELSGRSAGTNTSLAVKPFCCSRPRRQLEKLLMAISTRPVVVGRVGELQGPGRQGELSSCGKRKAASCADSGAHLLLSALRHQATTILFYCCILVLFFSSLVMRGRKEGAGTQQ